jgi:amidase
MHLTEYATYDALGLAQLVRSGQIRPAKLLEVAMQAVEAVNPEIHAVVGTTLEEASAALLRNPAAPFFGVPFLVKDLGLSLAGVASEGGARLFKGSIAARDCELGSRLKRAGLMTIGRTNTPEFGNNASTEPVAQGPTRNPWDLGRSPGGSSGGSAAAVAAGITPIAHASDGGGSIRIPAGHCGVFGLKPSRARNPTGPDGDEFLFGLVNPHVITRSVRDSAAMLDATCGPESGGRIALPRPSIAFSGAVERPPGRLRIAFTAEPPLGAPRPAPECSRMIEDVVALCQDLGHELQEAAPAVDFEDLVSVFSVLSAAVIKHLVDGLPAPLASKVGEPTLEATTLKAIALGAKLTAMDLLNVFDVMNRIARSLGSFFESYDVWLSPVAATPPLPLGALNANHPNLSATEWTRQFLVACPYTTMFNVSGQPAMSIPLHWSAQGLPIGSHFAARTGEESTLLSLAAQLEEARPWAHRRPRVHVASRTTD